MGNYNSTKNSHPENSHPSNSPLENLPPENSHKIPTWNIPPPPISLTDFLHFFFTEYFVHKWGGDVHVNPAKMKNVDMSRTAQCSHFRKNSNN